MQAAKSLGNTLRAFQPTIRELTQVGLLAHWMRVFHGPCAPAELGSPC